MSAIDPIHGTEKAWTHVRGKIPDETHECVFILADNVAQSPGVDRRVCPILQDFTQPCLVGKERGERRIAIATCARISCFLETGSKERQLSVEPLGRPGSWQCERLNGEAHDVERLARPVLRSN
jgi:hypothetical protein